MVKKTTAKSSKNTTKDDKLLKRSKYSLKTLLTLTLIVASLLFLASGWAWYTKIAINPDRVLNDAIENSWKTNSVTKKINQESEMQDQKQTTYISFYSPYALVESRTVLSQKGLQREETTITTDTIGANGADYIRYTKVEGAKNLPGAENLDKLIGQWAKRDADKNNGGSSEFLNEALFSVLPIGNLKPDNRAALSSFADSRQIYKTITPAERKIDNYRPVYEYSLSMKPTDLISLLSEYAKMTGLADPKQFNPDAYANTPPLNIRMSVDIASRRVVKINYVDSGRIETFTSYNLYRPERLPKNAITFEELQQRLLGDKKEES